MSEVSFNPHQLLTCEDLAELTRISYSAIRKACCSDPGRVKISLPRITRIGTRVRFRADHVREWLDSLSDSPVLLSDSPALLAESLQKAEPVVTFSKAARRPGRPRNAGGQK